MHNYYIRKHYSRLVRNLMNRYEIYVRISPIMSTNCRMFSLSAVPKRAISCGNPSKITTFPQQISYIIFFYLMKQWSIMNKVSLSPYKRILSFIIYHILCYKTENALLVVEIYKIITHFHHE